MPFEIKSKQVFFIGFSISPFFYLSLIGLYVSFCMYVPQMQDCSIDSYLFDNEISYDISKAENTVLQWQDIPVKTVDKPAMCAFWRFFAPMPNIRQSYSAGVEFFTPLQNILDPYLLTLYSRPPPFDV